VGYRKFLGSQGMLNTKFAGATVAILREMVSFCGIADPFGVNLLE
jgi:hypothetical protein